MNLYPVYLLCYRWSAAAIGLDDGMHTHSFRPSALRSAKECTAHTQPPLNPAALPKPAFFFPPQSAESAAGNIKMLREASSLFLILCLQPIFSSQSLGWRTVMLCYRWHVVLWRLSYRKYILPTQEYVGLHPYIHIMIYICALFTLDTSEVHFAVLCWTSCFVAVLPVLLCVTLTRSARRCSILMSFTCSRLSSRRFSLCAPPTRHLFSSLSTHMSAISWSALVSLSAPSFLSVAVCPDVVARSSRGLLVCGTFGFFSVVEVGFSDLLAVLRPSSHKKSASPSIQKQLVSDPPGSQNCKINKSIK